MIRCSGCGERHDIEEKYYRDIPALCSSECVPAYVADTESQQVTLIDDSDWRRYNIAYCSWCKQPFPKRAERATHDGEDYCSRWCQGRDKANADVQPPTLERDNDEWRFIRQQAWERDDEKCQLCGRPRGAIGRRPTVAIVDANLDDPNVLENTVCLCPACLTEATEEDRQRAAQGEPSSIEADEVLCPSDSCSADHPNSWFDTERAMKIHYGTTHEGSLATDTRDCARCGSTFEFYPSRNRNQIHCRDCLDELNDYNREQCPECGDEYAMLGVHWSLSERCDFPDLDEEKMEIMTGLLMGDATVQKSGDRDKKNPVLKWTNTNEPFMGWIDEQLEFMTLGSYDLLRTPEESAANVVESGLADRADSEDYQPMYVNLSRAHPALQELEEWYETGEKKFPIEELRLTPLTMKVWYACDGTLNTGNPKPRAKFACTNEKDRAEELATVIEEAVGASISVHGDGEKLMFNTAESRAFFEYVGWDPLPGFEYKWPDKSEYE